MDPSVVQLLLSGGAGAVLAALVILILRGDLVTKRAADERIAAVRELIAELSSSREEWKGIAKESVADVGVLGEALTVRNRIDEALTKKVDDMTKAQA